MTVKIGINGFGRIGRAVLRAMINGQDTSFEVVHINDLASPQTLAHLLKYDSVHGTLDADISVDDNVLSVNGKSITISACQDPLELPWAQKNVHIVFECSGRFRKKEQCERHLQAGAKKVLISAPASGEDRTVVYGVNHKDLRSEDKIVSNGSCTTNCLAPPTKVLDDHFSIVSGLVTTVHAYTNDQSVL
ncbi:MAG: erythrose-4-phosphate dehydrogenase, partial [Zetaproteobacteria bacterium]|nr:erythrose-4-phosphate dehydrogenase [Pseudobdellovibrionaceae bacterium]